MPLSDEEKRILDEIERNLQRDDPRLAREVRERSVYRHALGSMRWTIVTMILGLAIVVATLQYHYLLALVGVLLMIVGGLGLERQLSLMGRVGIRQLSDAIRQATPRVADEESAD